MARSFGASQTLAKPFSGEELLAVVESVLSE
jgi:DNA-binding response OmpR family regulator